VIAKKCDEEKLMGRARTRKKLVVLGAGKMGTILLQAFLKKGLVTSAEVAATVQHAEKAKQLAKLLKVSVETDNRAAARGAEVLLISVKPPTVGQVVEQISSEISEDQLVISIAASVPTSYIEQRLQGRVPVIRAMPNTPAQVGCGMTALCAGSHAQHAHLERAQRLFESIGRSVVVDEKHMDAVTGLSASGPAFLYIILESLAEAGVKVGLPRDLATLLAAQTALGAAQVVLQTGDHPALLKDAVTTPAGCTIDGILELEEGKLRVTLIKAVVKATERARQLLFS